MEREYSINGSQYTVGEYAGLSGSGFAWTLWSKDGGELAEADDFFPTACEALQDAMDYETKRRPHESDEAEYREEQEEWERHYRSVSAWANGPRHTGY